MWTERTLIHCTHTSQDNHPAVERRYTSYSRSSRSLSMRNPVRERERQPSVCGNQQPHTRAGSKRIEIQSQRNSRVVILSCQSIFRQIRNYKLHLKHATKELHFVLTKVLKDFSINLKNPICIRFPSYYLSRRRKICTKIDNIGW